MRAAGGSVLVDLQALQAPSSRARGIGEYARSYVRALERFAPDLVGAYVLNPNLAPPAPFEELTGSGKVAWWGGISPHRLGASVLHLLSPLDPELAIGELWPVEATRLALSVTVYDLIPTHDLAAALIDPVARRRYRTRLELVRNAHGVQVLTAAVGRELTDRLGVPAERITRIGAAVDPELSRPVGADANAALDQLGVRDAYVLYPSGTHPRKNNEALVEAFAHSDAPSRGMQLVIAGDFPEPTVRHLLHLATRHGIGESVLVPGYLDASLFRALVQRAALVCFPSLAEGFGLPVAEAIALGIPVIASDRAPLDELVPESARFDPSSASTIADAISHALATPPVPPAPSSLDSDEQVAARATAAFADLATRGRNRATTVRSPRARRGRVAFVSPFPPAPSGIAAYSSELASALSSLDRVELTLFGDGPTPGQHGPDGAPVLPAGALIAQEALLGRFDEVVYALGNSHHHLGALRLLRGRPGVVLAHDVRLTNLYRHLHGDPGFALGGLGREIASMYEGHLPEEVGITGAVSARDLERFGVLMAREAIRRSERFFVSSDAARSLARTDAGRDLADRVETLPFAFFAANRSPSFEEAPRPAPETLGGAARYWGRPPDELLGNPVLAHFGIVDPIKEPELVIAAVAIVRSRFPDAVLALVGPVADDLAGALAASARSAGVENAVFLTGPLGPEDYRAWLARAGVAVQLRRSSNGEASAALGECLASGVPTVVRDGGFFRELPADAVARLKSTDRASELADLLVSLLDDEPRRAALGAGGRALATTRTFTRTAEELLDRLSRSTELARPA